MSIFRSKNADNFTSKVGTDFKEVQREDNDYEYLESTAKKFYEGLK